jgi:hypothetical protein
MGKFNWIETLLILWNWQIYTIAELATSVGYWLNQRKSVGIFDTESLVDMTMFMLNEQDDGVAQVIGDEFGHRRTDDDGIEIGFPELADVFHEGIKVFMKAVEYAGVDSG